MFGKQKASGESTPSERSLTRSVKKRPVPLSHWRQIKKKKKKLLRKVSVLSVTLKQIPYHLLLSAYFVSRLFCFFWNLKYISI